MYLSKKYCFDFTKQNKNTQLSFQKKTHTSFATYHTKKYTKKTKGDVIYHVASSAIDFDCTTKPSFCRFHSWCRKNMLEDCTKMRNEYQRLSELTSLVPNSFFSSKANTMSTIIQIMEQTLQKRMIEYRIGIDTSTLVKTTKFPKDLTELVISFIPM